MRKMKKVAVMKKPTNKKYVPYKLPLSKRVCKKLCYTRPWRRWEKNEDEEIDCEVTDNCPKLMREKPNDTVKMYHIM
jgi:hypothetical protein